MLLINKFPGAPACTLTRFVRFKHPLLLSLWSDSNHILKKDTTSLAGLRKLQQHTRFPTLNTKVTAVMNDMGEILYGESVRNGTRCLQNNEEAVFDVCEKLSGAMLDPWVVFNIG